MCAISKTAERQGMKMSQDQQFRAILFVDICDSTELYDTLGDERALQLVGACINWLASCAHAEGGKVIKTTGDGVLITFTNADSALMAAIAMRHARSDLGLQVRIGFHVGRIIDDCDDIYGDAVNVAARIAALAKPREIIFSQQSRDRLSKAMRAATRLIDRAKVKGKRAEIEIYGLVSAEQDSTVVSECRPRSDARATRLALTYRDRRFAVGTGNGRFAIGRDTSCDLVLDGQLISRHHAVIEAKRDKFYLQDYSTNGTFVCYDRHHPVFLRRESVQLLGDGVISLGEAPAQGGNDLIRFSSSEGSAIESG